MSHLRPGLDKLQYPQTKEDHFISVMTGTGSFWQSNEIQSAKLADLMSNILIITP